MHTKNCRHRSANETSPFLAYLLGISRASISDDKECVIPYVKLDEEARLILADRIDDVDRELEFIDSYDRTLDSILRLQDVGLIRIVEKL